MNENDIPALCSQLGEVNHLHFSSLSLKLLISKKILTALRWQLFSASVRTKISDQCFTDVISPGLTNLNELESGTNVND